MDFVDLQNVAVITGSGTIAKAAVILGKNPSAVSRRLGWGIEVRDRQEGEALQILGVGPTISAVQRVSNWVRMSRRLVVVGVVASMALALSCDTPAQVQKRSRLLVCQAHTSLCSAGPDDDGGCYAPNANVCVQGRICPTGTSVCSKGAFGTGGCFDPSVAQCNDGAVMFFLLTPPSTTQK